MLPIVLLSAAGFTVLSTEFVMVGLLPAIARDLDISISRAGWLVTLFALVVALFGPVMTALFAGVERKRLFVAALLLVGMSNMLAALAPNLVWLTIARLLPALGLPVFWALASETVVTLAGPAGAGRAMARFGVGTILAMVLGIPLGTLIGDVFGWRTVFVVLGALALFKALLLAVWMPTSRAQKPVSVLGQAGLLRQGLMQAHVLLSVLIFCGIFTIYTYLAALLEQLAGMDSAGVAWCLMGFGLLGLVGNALGGRVVDRHPLIASLLFSGLLIAGLLVVIPVIEYWPGLIASLILWAIAQSALFLICHVRLMQAAPEAQAFAASLNISGCNLGIGLGAIAGGQVIDSLGLATVGVAAAAIIGLSIILTLVML